MSISNFVRFMNRNKGKYEEVTEKANVTRSFYFTT